MKTQAEMALVDAYNGARDHLPGTDVLRGHRARAFDVFHERGLPHRRIEAWHYTDLRGVLREVYPMAAQAPAGVVADLQDGALRLVIADGQFASATGLVPAGLSITPLRDAMASGTEAFADRLFPSMATEDAVVAYNGAMMRDGVVIEVAAGAKIKTPVELLFTSGEGKARSDLSRVLVVLGEGASLTLVESHEARAKVQRNAVLVVQVAQGAHLEHVFEAGEQAPEMLLSSVIADVGKDAQFESFGLISGGDVVRRQMFVTGSGENASIALRGVSLLRGKQHADTTLVVEHQVPHGTSRELFKHILDDEATGVYQGKVVVRPVAQKTDGGMKSHALMLTDGPAMYNKPELEIFADDVVCGHGATVGQLDENQLFYLQSRGIPRENAEALLIEAFAREAIEFVTNEPLRERLEGVLASWLKRRAS
jgi:Fe-S cluster assembly protein SufD